MNRRAHREAVRNRLLDLGYQPLPLCKKACYIQGWSKATITPEWLAAHASGRYQSTGLRCDELVAVDIDIADADLSFEIEGLVYDLSGCGEHYPPRRFRENSNKILLLFKGDPGQHYTATSKRLLKGRTVQVEILRGSGRQFQSHGLHPSGVEINWDYEGETNPLTGLPPFHELPFLTIAAVKSILADVEAEFDDLGLEIEKMATDSSGWEPQPILENTSEFLTHDGVYTVAELENHENIEEGIFGCPIFVRPDSDSYGALAKVTPSGRFQITDFVKCTLYTKKDVVQGLSLPDGTGSFAEVEKTRENVAKRLLLGEPLEDSVFIAQGSQFVWPPHPDEEPLSMVDARNLYSKQVVDNWMTSHPDQVVRRRVYDPEKPPRAVFTDTYGVPVFNDYYEAPNGPHGGDLSIVREFFAHLYPDREQRELVFSWLAWKTQNPWKRGYAVVNVAESQGTGRGFMGRLITKIFHSSNVNTISLDALLGNQSAFTGFLDRCLMLVVDEAQAMYQGDSYTKSGKRAYEHLKQLVDQGQKEMEINPKYGKPRKSIVYASFFISTNHADALPIPEGDRRFLVVENGPPMTQGLAKRLEAFLVDETSLRSLRHYLRNMTIENEEQFMAHAPMTHAKHIMYEASKSDVDLMVEDWVSELKELGVCSFRWSRMRDWAVQKHPTEWSALQARIKHAVKVKYPGKSHKAYFPDGQHRVVWISPKKYDKARVQADDLLLGKLRMSSETK